MSRLSYSQSFILCLSYVLFIVLHFFVYAMSELVYVLLCCLVLFAVFCLLSSSLFFVLVFVIWGEYERLLREMVRAKLGVQCTWSMASLPRTLSGKLPNRSALIPWNILCQPHKPCVALCTPWWRASDHAVCSCAHCRVRWDMSDIE